MHRCLASVDPSDLCVLSDSGWRDIDQEHFDYLLNEALAGNYMKNVLAKPKIHLHHKGGDGRRLILDGKHITLVVLKTKKIHAKLEEGDEEYHATYGNAEFSAKLVHAQSWP